MKGELPRDDPPAPWRTMDPPEGERLVQWLLWLKERPECVRKVVAVLPPWKIYRFKRKTIYVEPVSIVAYDEEHDGSCSLSVTVASPLNPRSVFGVKPGDLEELKLESEIA